MVVLFKNRIYDIKCIHTASYLSLAIGPLYYGFLATPWVDSGATNCPGAQRAVEEERRRARAVPVR